MTNGQQPPTQQRRGWRRYVRGWRKYAIIGGGIAVVLVPYIGGRIHGRSDIKEFRQQLKGYATQVEGYETQVNGLTDQIREMKKADQIEDAKFEQDIDKLRAHIEREQEKAGRASEELSTEKAERGRVEKIIRDIREDFPERLEAARKDAVEDYIQELEAKVPDPVKKIRDYVRKPQHIPYRTVLTVDIYREDENYGFPRGEFAEARAVFPAKLSAGRYKLTKEQREKLFEELNIPAEERIVCNGREIVFENENVLINELYQVVVLGQMQEDQVDARESLTEFNQLEILEAWKMIGPDYIRRHRKAPITSRKAENDNGLIIFINDPRYIKFFNSQEYKVLDQKPKEGPKQIECTGKRRMRVRDGKYQLEFRPDSVEVRKKAGKPAEGYIRGRVKGVKPSKNYHHRGQR